MATSACWAARGRENICIAGVRWQCLSHSGGKYGTDPSLRNMRHEKKGNQMKARNGLDVCIGRPTIMRASAKRKA